MDNKKKNAQPRPLTAAELARKAAFEQTEEEMKQNGYTAHDLTFDATQANLLAIVITIPIALLLFVAYFAKNGLVSFRLSLFQILLFLVVMLGLFVIHELIHGITWAIFAKDHWKSISFGILMPQGNPYCTCNAPLKKSEYVLGGIMPTLLLGLLPALIGIQTGIFSIFLMGVLMTIGGGGDLLLIQKLLRYKPKGREVIYLDHPHEIGLIAFER